MNEEEIYNLAIKKWGVSSQMGVAQEECAELIKAISKWFRNIDNGENLEEEVADVEIMLEQLKIILDKDLIQEKKREKLKRLQKRVMKE
jgi:NTP pyrophosphatase (non-canonical NTP hydrolase)